MPTIVGKLTPQFARHREYAYARAYARPPGNAAEPDQC
jgi:hypothetical protein